MFSRTIEKSSVIPAFEYTVGTPGSVRNCRKFANVLNSFSQRDVLDRLAALALGRLHRSLETGARCPQACSDMAACTVSSCPRVRPRRTPTCPFSTGTKSTCSATRRGHEQAQGRVHDLRPDPVTAMAFATTTFDAIATCVLQRGQRIDRSGTGIPARVFGIAAPTPLLRLHLGTIIRALRSPEAHFPQDPPRIPRIPFPDISPCIDPHRIPPGGTAMRPRPPASLPVPRLPPSSPAR